MPTSPIAVFWTVLALTLAAGCGQDPRVARRQGAIDLEGAWQEVGGGALVTVANEASVNDVVVDVTGRALPEGELAAVARIIDDTVRQTVSERLVMGDGADLELEESEGGENVSFDDGATTTLQVISAALPARPMEARAQDASVRWSLRVAGDATGLAGTLTVTSLESRLAPTDIDGRSLQAIQSIRPIRLVPAVR